MDYLMSFITAGIVGIPILVLVFLCTDTIKGKILGFSMTLIFWALFSSMICYQVKENERKWNNGYCTCGTHWELKGATKTSISNVTKYYECPNCYQEIELYY